MHPIHSAGDSSLVTSQNSNSSTSMQKSANIQFVSDSPITDPGQSSKVSEAERLTEVNFAQVKRVWFAVLPESVWHVYDPVFMSF